MLKEELRVRALSMIQLPAHFQPILEERFEGENGEGEAVFMCRDATSPHPYTLFSVIVWWSFIHCSPKAKVHEVLMLLETRELLAS